MDLALGLMAEPDLFKRIADYALLAMRGEAKK
jgi:hypothetical protein